MWLNRREGGREKKAETKCKLATVLGVVWSCANIRLKFREHIDDLALILTLENGKTLAEAKGEVTYAATFIEWFAGEAERTHGEVVPVANQNQRVLTFKVSTIILITA